MATPAGGFANTADELDLLVLEYLMHTGCEGPADALKQHMRARVRGPAAWRPVGDDVRQQIFAQALDAFDAGRGEELFTLWESYVPPLVRRRDRTCAKLEFYLHIYFAVFPQHANNRRRDAADLGASMERFKRYLETNGATLSATAEFLAYYALPYVPQLTEHPAFRELLTPGWAGALRQRVADFLRTTPQLASEPKLLAIYRSYESLTLDGEHGVPHNPMLEASADLSALKARLVESELRMVEGKQLSAQREAALGRTATDLLRVASEQQARLARLTGAGTPRSAGQRGAIQRAADALAALGLALPQPRGAVGGGGGVGGSPYGGGEARDMPSPSPPPPPPQAMRGSPAYEADEAELEERQRLPPRPRSVPLFAALDYGAVRRDLEGQPAPQRALLLQALRWRLMKSTGRQRQLVLAAYVQHDLVSEPIMAACLSAHEPLVLEQCVRLLNHFASFAAGRAYVLSRPGLLTRLCALLLAEEADSPTRQNVLGALQKLSLRRAPQSSMIEGGVVGWLCAVLAEPEALSEYTIEYATALLMNLSLRLAGKRACESPGLDVLSVLSGLLEYENGQVRTYVNGTLYSVLTRPALRERALEMGLPDILEALLAHSDEMNRRQLQYILPLLTAELPDTDPAAEAEAEKAEEDGHDDDDDVDDDDDDDDEEDEEEPDDDDETELPRPDRMPYGEELLASRYIASAYDAQAEASQLEATGKPSARRRPPAKLGSSKGVPAGGAEEPLQRPSTPGLNGVPKPPPALPEYPNLDGSEDIEITFASRNKLARTPAPGAQASGLADLDYGPSSPRPREQQRAERRAPPKGRSPSSLPKAGKPPSGAAAAGGKAASAKKAGAAGGAKAQPSPAKKPLREAAAADAPVLDASAEGDADATAAQPKDAPEAVAGEAGPGAGAFGAEADGDRPVSKPAAEVVPGAAAEAAGADGAAPVPVPAAEVPEAAAEGAEPERAEVLAAAAASGADD